MCSYEWKFRRSAWKKSLGPDSTSAGETCAKPRSPSPIHPRPHWDPEWSIHPPRSWCIHPVSLLHVIISPFINKPASVIQRRRGLGGRGAGGGLGATPDEAGIIMVVGVRQTTCANFKHNCWFTLLFLQFNRIAVPCAIPYTNHN